MVLIFHVSTRIKIQIMLKYSSFSVTRSAVLFAINNSNSNEEFLIFRLVSLTPIVMKDFVGNYMKYL